MSVDSIIQSLTWYAHILLPCLVPAREQPAPAEPEQSSTAITGSVENLPKDIALRIIHRVFARSKKDYGALLQTCKTIHGEWNTCFFQSMEPLPLYKTLLRCSQGDDVRVGAIFRRVLDLQEDCPIFFDEQELELDLTDVSTMESLQSACARFPNCNRLSIMDKRTPPSQQTVPEQLVKELFHVDSSEPQIQSIKEARVMIVAATRKLPQLGTLTLTRRPRPTGKMMDPWLIASALGRSARVNPYHRFHDGYTSTSITLSSADDTTFQPREKE